MTNRHIDAARNHLYQSFRLLVRNVPDINHDDVRAIEKHVDGFVQSIISATLHVQRTHTTPTLDDAALFNEEFERNRKQGEK